MIENDGTKLTIRCWLEVENDGRIWLIEPDEEIEAVLSDIIVAEFDFYNDGINPVDRIGPVEIVIRRIKDGE